MNAREGLERIRDRLLENGAQDATLTLVETMIRNASTPEAEKAQASQLQLVRMLARTPVATNNYPVYNDLVKLEAEMSEVSERRRAEAEAEADRPMPKSKKYYKELKEKEQKEKERAKREA
jgi:hypothetical protein